MQHSTPHTDQERKLIYTMMLSSILPLLDSSIINVILPNISQDIGISHFYIQWAVTVYMLSCSAGIILSPLISKNFGAKSSWFYSMLIFLTGSVLVGLSCNLTTLIISRCVQGVGAGVLMPVCQSVLAIQFEKPRLKQVMALIAIPTVFAPALGPLLGAILSDSVSWRVAFFINVPIALVAFLIGYKVFPQSNKIKGRMNYFVFLLFFISLVMIFISVDDIFSGGSINNDYVMALFVSFIFLIVSVILNNKSSNKVINLSQLNRKKYSLSILMGFLTSLIFFGFLIFFPLAKSGDQDLSITYVGALLALQGGGAWLARKFIYQRISNYNTFMIIGVSILISSFSLLIIEKEGLVFESIGFIIRGSGLGIATILTLSSPFEFGENEYIHDTSAITRVIQQIGGASGGLLAGSLIQLIGQKAIHMHNAYQILFLLSASIGLFSIIMALVLKRVNNEMKYL